MDFYLRGGWERWDLLLLHNQPTSGPATIAGTQTAAEVANIPKRLRWADIQDEEQDLSDLWPVTTDIQVLLELGSPTAMEEVRLAKKQDARPAPSIPSPDAERDLPAAGGGTPAEACPAASEAMVTMMSRV